MSTLKKIIKFFFHFTTYFYHTTVLCKMLRVKISLRCTDRVFFLFIARFIHFGTVVERRMEQYKKNYLFAFLIFNLHFDILEQTNMCRIQTLLNSCDIVYEISKKNIQKKKMSFLAENGFCRKFLEKLFVSKLPRIFIK